MNKVNSPSEESGPVRRSGSESLVSWLIRHPAADSGLTQRSAIWIFFMPLLIVLACILMILPPATRPWYHWLVAENRPVEIATFLFLLASGIGGLALAARLALRGAKFAACFYAVFSLGLLLVAIWATSYGFLLPASWPKNPRKSRNIPRVGGMFAKQPPQWSVKSR